MIGGPVDLVVGDLSFISLELVLEPLIGVTAPDGDLALMVKPQFEVGKGRVGKGGVVREPGLRDEAVRAVADGRRRGAAGVPRAVDGQPAAGPVGQRRVLPVAAARVRRRSARTTSTGRCGTRRGPGVPGEKVEP